MVEIESTKPNLFIVGAAKCGTTAWHAYLRDHPDIFFADVKEPNYFATDLPLMRAFTSVSRYEKLFARGRGARYRGEASGIYLYSTEAARGIRDYDPDARILIFLRQPEEFLLSYHHQMLYRFNENIEDFETAWRLSGKRPADSIPATCRDPKLLDYAARAAFGQQVERFFAMFPADQICVIGFEEWTSDPRATYLRILRFLGLEDDGRTHFPRINEAKQYRIKWLGKMIAHPPRLAMTVVKLLRKLSGRDSLGIGAKASELLASKGYRTSIGDELRAEIRRFYEEDNRKLQQLLEKRTVR